ncbi:helix-turn-helix domain-containing protein [Tersicoccus sp. MR15.9]|uniref:helix-turn-helix domain-containing protein n=1 Tax=Tersicoccus mangrovi TaxID=3121635 RepID=UPI002FE58312
MSTGAGATADAAHMGAMITATYDRPIEATLAVQLENGEEWPATAEDVARFGYQPIDQVSTSAPVAEPAPAAVASADHELLGRKVLGLVGPLLQDPASAHRQAILDAGGEALATGVHTWLLSLSQYLKSESTTAPEKLLTDLTSLLTTHASPQLWPSQALDQLAAKRTQKVAASAPKGKGGRQPALSTQRASRVRKLHAEGMSVADIARKLGVASASVERALDTGRKFSPAGTPAAMIEAARKLRAEGKTWPQVGAELGVNVKSITNAVNRLERLEREAA